jgi:hypothetical protein
MLFVESYAEIGGSDGYLHAVALYLLTLEQDFPFLIDHNSVPTLICCQESYSLSISLMLSNYALILHDLEFYGV